MWVVKIGGSLETAPGLPCLLASLADYGRSKVVIVPGGGQFADRVRAEQRAAGMNDATAHRLAIRSMEQYGALLCRMEPRLYPVAEPDAIGGVGKEATVPVWFPAKLLGAQTDIPANWQVTSDSLALWFAGEINAEALILVKSVRNKSRSAQELAASGYLDGYFPEMMKKVNLELIACVGIDEWELLQQGLASGTIPPIYELSAEECR